MLTTEQAEEFKRQLIEQIEASFPEDKKQFAISQIEAMDSEQLEKFLIRNRLLKKEGADSSVGHCVFCSIVFGDIKSYKIAENSKAIAVLEINPVSRGHAIVIPKDHITSAKNLPEQVSALSKKVSSLLKSKLKPEEVKVEGSNVLGHGIINVIPVYEGQKETGEKHHSTEEELSELQKLLKGKTAPRKPQIEKIKKIKKTEPIKEKFWLPRRIP